MQIFEKSEKEIKKATIKNRIFGIIMALVGLLIVIANESLKDFTIGLCVILILVVVTKLAFKNDKIKNYFSKGVKKDDYKRVTALTQNATGIFVFTILFFLSDMEAITISGWLFLTLGISIAYGASKKPELKIVIDENMVYIYHKGEVIREFDLDKSIVYIRTANKVRTLCFEEGEKIYGCVEQNIGKENFKNIEKLLASRLEYL